MRKIYFFLILLAVILTGCKSSETVASDTQPPFKPDMIEHLGDTGDGQVYYEVMRPDGPVTESVIPNDANNGIDAISGGDWIKIQWDPFVDSDLDYVKVFRYHMATSGIKDLTLVDSVSASNTVSTYEDYSLSSIPGSVIGREWFYYLELFDRSGNSTLSDTVSYYLLEQIALSAPYNQSVVQSSSDLTFKWHRLQSGSFSRYRILLFDADKNVLWTADETDVDGDETILQWDYNGAVLFPGEYFWRVDAMGDIQLYDSGSESGEWSFTIE